MTAKSHWKLDPEPSVEAAQAEDLLRGRVESLRRDAQLVIARAMRVWSTAP